MKMLASAHRSLLFIAALLQMHAGPTMVAAGPPSSSSAHISLVGYPGVLSKEYVQSRVEDDIRDQIVGLLAPHPGGGVVRGLATSANTVASTNLDSVTRRILKNDDNREKDSDGLNDLLASFELDIPEQIIEQPILGATATFVITGLCNNIEIKRIGLDYDIDKKEDTLTYDVLVEKLDVDCRIDVVWDAGVFDIEDELSIAIKLRDNNFAVGVVLEGIPPKTSTFQGCQAEVYVKDIKAEGGFSANILNELDDLVQEIVNAETPTISQLLCEQVTEFSSVVDGLLMSIADMLEPYFGEAKDIDPLSLEKNLQVAEELVDYTDSSLGHALSVIVKNLEGVFGAFQVNTLVELNLLDEDGFFIVDFQGTEESRLLQEEECSLVRQRRKLISSSANSIVKDLGLNRKRTLQTEDDFFTVNSLDILSIQLTGLNSFEDVGLLEIIGKYTFRSKFGLKGLDIKATVLLNADVNNVNIQETIVITLPVDKIDITASYLVGLSEAVVSDFEIGSLLGSGNLQPCLLSALVVVGLSELDVTVSEVGTPIVSGLLDSGVDELIGTAIEAAVEAYQELIIEAVPNIFQKNVTVAINDYLECFVRTEAAAAVCPKPENSLGSVLFDFRRNLKGAYEEAMGSLGRNAWVDVLSSVTQKIGILV